MSSINVLPDTPMIVFVHGWSCRASDWDATLAALQPVLGSEYQLLAPDLPGHGSNTHQLWHDWTIPGLARALVNQLPATVPVTLVGHSMGGCVALEAAMQLDNPVQQVILVDTFGLPYGDMDEATIDSIETPFRRDFVAAMHALVDNTTPASLDNNTRNWLKTRMSNAAPDKMLPLWHKLLRWSPDAAFSTIQCPIHAINGEHIPAIAQDRCAPHVTSHVLAGSHHFPQIEQPKHFQQLLLKLLNEQHHHPETPRPAVAHHLYGV